MQKQPDSPRGFTLMELMVVITIIILLASLALPTISHFMKGRRLDQTGRVIQAIFNDARRKTVSNRTRHRLIFYRYPETVNGKEITVYAVRIYKDGVGYVGEPYMLPRGLAFDTQNQGIQVFDELPEEDSDFFDVGSNPGRVEYRKDGTILFNPPAKDVPSKVPGVEGYLYDLNNKIRSVPMSTPADLIVTQRGTKKRCFIDVVPNTGRVNYRVLEVTKGKEKNN